MTIGGLLSWSFNFVPRICNTVAQILVGVIGRLANSSLARIWDQTSPNMSKSMQSARVWLVG
jgi:hypothetical protein